MGLCWNSAGMVLPGSCLPFPPQKITQGPLRADMVERGCELPEFAGAPDGQAFGEQSGEVGLVTVPEDAILNAMEYTDLVALAGRYGFSPTCLPDAEEARETLRLYRGETRAPAEKSTSDDAACFTRSWTHIRLAGGGGEVFRNRAAGGDVPDSS
eukprot:gene12477-biopygen28